MANIQHKTIGERLFDQLSGCLPCDESSDTFDLQLREQIIEDRITEQAYLNFGCTFLCTIYCGVPPLPSLVLCY